MDRLDKTNLPRHIAIIMDGNGRWAQNHSLGRIAGHRKGAESVRNIVEACRKIGISYLTLYAFSSENWSRPEREVRALMTLLERYLKSEVKVMLKNNIRLLAIGDTGALPESVRTILRDTIEKTAGNTAMTLILALNYGSHDEILGAVRQMLDEARQGKIRPSDVTLERFAQYLFTKGIPNPDLLIRTSGEYRLSNFLLWQMAYTEFYFTDTLWPDFREEQLIEAILEFQRRETTFRSDKRPGAEEAMMASSHIKRWITGIIAVPILFSIIYFSTEVIFAGFVVVVTVVAVLEYNRLVFGVGNGWKSRRCFCLESSCRLQPPWPARERSLPLPSCRPSWSSSCTFSA